MLCSADAIEEIRRQFAFLIEIGFDHGSPNGLPGVFGQQYRRSWWSRQPRSRLPKWNAIPNRNTLTQQILQHFLNHSEGEQFRDQILDQLGFSWPTRSQNNLASCRENNSAGVLAHQFRQMRAHHIHRVDHRIARRPRGIHLIGRESTTPASRRPARASAVPRNSLSALSVGMASSLPGSNS